MAALAGLYTSSYGSCCHGPYVQYLLSGSLTFTVGGPTQVIRADGATEQVAADTTTTLVAGDTLLTRNEYPVATSNAGNESADVLDWLLIDDPNAQFGGRQGEGWEFHDLYATGEVPEITGAVALTIRRAVLAPDDYVPVVNGNLVLEVTGDPEVDVVKRFNEEGIWPIESHGAVTVVYVFSMIPLKV